MAVSVETLVSRLPISNSPVRTPFRRFFELLPHFAEMAEVLAKIDEGATGNAIWNSYRAYPVIALTFSDDPKTTEELSGVLVGGNQKAEGKEKVCAETRLLRRAVKNQARVIPGIFLRAPGGVEQIAEVCDGLPRRTLPPCAQCSQNFEDIHEKSILDITPEMPIVTSAFGEQGYQVATPFELKQFYTHREVPRQFHRTMPGFEGWSERLGLYDEWVQFAGAVALEDTVVQHQLLHAALVVPAARIEAARGADNWRDVLAA